MLDHINPEEVYVVQKWICALIDLGRFRQAMFGLEPGGSFLKQVIASCLACIHTYVIIYLDKYYVILGLQHGVNCYGCMH